MLLCNINLLFFEVGSNSCYFWKHQTGKQIAEGMYKYTYQLLDKKYLVEHTKQENNYGLVKKLCVHHLSLMKLSHYNNILKIHYVFRVKSKALNRINLKNTNNTCI